MVISLPFFKKCGLILFEAALFLWFNLLKSPVKYFEPELCNGNLLENRPARHLAFCSNFGPYP